MSDSTPPPLLSATALGKTFGGVVALNAFDMTLHQGDLVGLIGPNGAGKTTAFNLLTGVLRHGSGSIRLRGEEIGGLGPEQRAKRGLSRTFQNIRLFDELTVLQNVKAGAHAGHAAGLAATLMGLPRFRAAEREIEVIARQALDLCGLAEVAEERADALSYGDRRRVEIARALAAEPRLLLLDEPAAGMNQTEKEALSSLIRRLNEDQGLTIVLVEHNVPMVAALCRRVVVLDKGELLAEGVTAEILADPQVVDVYLGRRRGAAGGAYAEA